AGNTVWAASLAVSAPFAVHREAASLVAGCKPTWRDMLRSLTMPKTVLVGERSLPSPDFDGLADVGCDVAIVPEAGHSMAWDNPGGLADAIGKATG
ncbi:alpha/beta fold hydrolase, partial [Lysobacter sp. TAB13]|uniref:alpha/beta fold hydrolase n=1 Tax=Lysobacter sp. TAB13 TaxID=3233065 RepID=UPI003F9D8FD8